MNIVPMNMDEAADDIFALMEDALPGSWSMDSVQRQCQSPGCFGFFAESVKRQGFILARRCGEEVEILSVAVHPKAQKRGIGSALLMRCIEAAQGSRILLEVATDNPSALGLYTKAGFKQYSRRPQYYLRPNGRVDAVLMEK